MKIKVIKEPWNDSLSVLLYQEVNEKSYGKRWVVKPIELKLEEVKEGDQVKSTFDIPFTETHEFLKSMAEMAESMGIKTDKQEVAEQKGGVILEATKYHLEDMRRLVFESKDEKKEVNPNQ